MNDLAYAAGLFDGEGTVTLGRTHANKRRYPVISLTSTTKELVDIMKELFGGSIRARKIPKNPKHNQAWIWELTNDSAIEVLCKILPHLREPEKIRRADLIVRKYKLVTPRTGKYSEETNIAKLEFEKEFFKNSTKVSI